MARSSRRKGTRDPSESLAHGLRSRSRSVLLVTPTEVQDFRSFDAPVSSPARLFSGSVASVGVEQVRPRKGSKSRVPFQIAFTAPGDTIVCVRRARRKEVLHAKRKTGKRGQRKPRRSRFRDIKC